MGGTSYNDDMYASRISSAKTSKSGYFSHSADISTGKVAAGVHKNLDPSIKNKAGKLIRESLDSKEHPNSVPIAVLFDVTGSMSTVPRIFVEKLGALMKLLIKKGYLQDPQVLFGAIGDATTDRAPLQIGQFESGNEMDEVLSLIYLEGNGGGQQTESYELGMYYMARHTELDSLNKRGKKGYLFLMGDETPYSRVKKSEVKDVIGDELSESIPTDDILKELRDKFEVFWILPGGTSNYDNSHVNKYLKNMFGQNLLKLEKAEDVCELIASTIGICEGYDIKDIKDDLVDVGASKNSVDRALVAIADFASSKIPVKKAVLSGKLDKPKKSKKDTVERV